MRIEQCNFLQRDRSGCGVRGESARRVQGPHPCQCGGECPQGDQEGDSMQDAAAAVSQSHQGWNKWIFTNHWSPVPFVAWTRFSSFVVFLSQSVPMTILV